MAKRHFKIFFLTLIFTGWINISLAVPQTIYIYDDAGVSQESLAQTQQTFSAAVGKKYTVQTLNAEGVKNAAWVNDAALLVMPGGADVPYATKLDGAGNQVIKDYVKRGGAFLGICAGGYYGASFVEFDKNGSLEVIGPRELQFFPGKAVGPILAKYDYQSNSGVRVANVILKEGTVLGLYYNGGGFFSHAETYPNTSVIGWYQLPDHQKLPAIVKMQHGKGVVILSGVHFEYAAEMLDRDDKFVAKIVPVLMANSKKRELLVAKIFQLLRL